MPDTYDVAVIGAGPGGYIAAIRAAQLGFSVACIDDWTRADGKPAPGGTCTNVGCIPSKALLQSSEHYEHAGHAFAEHGIDVKGLAIDVKRMLARKDKVVAQNNDGILYLFRKNKVTFVHGRGAFAGGSAKDGWLLAVEGPQAAEIRAKHVIVATGSKPRPLPGAAFDNARVHDNAGALTIPEVPKRLGVVGAGVIGLEMGSVWRRLGAEVTVLEALPAFLGAADEAVAKEAQKLFARQGYHKTTIADLAQAIQLTSGAVFHHFASKEQLLDAVVEWLARGIRVYSDIVEAADRGSYELVLGTIRVMCDHFHRNPEATICLAALATELAGSNHPAEKRLKEVYELFVESFSRALANHPRVKDPRAAAIAFVGSVQGIAIQGLLREGEENCNGLVMPRPSARVARSCCGRMNVADGTRSSMPSAWTGSACRYGPPTACRSGQVSCTCCVARRSPMERRASSPPGATCATAPRTTTSTRSG